MSCTNNVSEGSHNYFRLVAPPPPDLYSCISEFQKDQTFTEVCIAELALCKRIKEAPKKQWVILQKRVLDYQSHKDHGTHSDYSETLGYNVVL